jgi:hypothetical protein
VYLNGWFYSPNLAPMPLFSHWKQLQKSSYSPDLAPSDYHLFGFVKHQLRGRFETREAIQKAVRQCLQMAGTEFYRRVIFKCVQRSDDYVEK